MTKRSKKSQPTETAAFTGEINPFENPEAALEEGSAAQLSILAGNDIEDPQDESFETGDNHELREKVKTLIRSADELYWDLAQSISRVANERIYKKWGFKSFEQYVNEECRIDKRKGQYFVQIHNYFDSTLRTILINHQEVYNHYLETAKSMGWVKARILAKEQVITDQNAEALLDKIKSCNVKQLEDICALAAAELSDEDSEKRAEENVDKMVRISLQATLAQAGDIEKAVEHVKSIGRPDMTRSSAVAMISRVFLDMDIIARGGKPDLSEHLASIERSFGIKLVAIDEQLGKIIYGEHVLRGMVGDVESVEGVAAGS